MKKRNASCYFSLKYKTNSNFNLSYNTILILILKEGNIFH